MSRTVSSTSDAEARFGRAVERADGVDFPFYDGRPRDVSTGRWVLIVLACIVGLAILLLYPAADDVQSLVPRILFTAVPLTVYAVATRPFWRAIFRRVHLVDLGAMVAFWLLTFAVSSLMALVVAAIFGVNANPATDRLATEGPLGIVAFYVGTGVQLLGEELLTVLPFLAVLYWLHARGRLGRRTAVVLAWLVTAVWFGAVHLPAYGFDVAQAFLVIGAARLVLTLAYIRTKNVWVSTGAHVLNDWSTFTVTLVGVLAHG
jgi:uncharacterized protein